MDKKSKTSLFEFMIIPDNHNQQISPTRKKKKIEQQKESYDHKEIS